jgi:hypothetical protein
MTLRQLLLIMALATAVCWLAWLAVLFQVDPTESGPFGLGLFYLCLFLALAGTFFLLSFTWRKIFSKFSLEYKIVGTSFRQSFFFALIVVGLFFLQSQNMLTWWNWILLILAVSIVEFFFLSSRKMV